MPMEAHDSLAQDPRSHAARRDSLRIDSSAFAVHTSSVDSPETPASSSRPRSSTTQHFSHDSPQHASPSSGPQRHSRPSTATSTKSSGPGSVPEKRKRSRVTPDQLQHLERIFAQDRSPTAARRKEISEMLGMHERQTQIWFQNRRAKAKNQDGKGKANRTSLSSSPPGTSPDAKPSQFDLDRHMLIHEEHPVNFIPCDDLTIGNWRRIASATTRNDLLAYSCDAKRCVTWYIQSTGFGFKMEIPYDAITRVELTPMPARPDRAQVSFFLSGVPAFFLDRIMPSHAAPGGAVHSWQSCQDWTEGSQASSVVRHDIVGPFAQMTAALGQVPLGSRIIGLGQPHYRAEPALSLQLPSRPLMTLPIAPPVPIVFPASDPAPASSSSGVQGRKRSYSGPPPQSSMAGDGPQPPYSAQGAIPMQTTGRPSSLQFNIAYPAPEHAPQYPGAVFRYAPPPLSQHSPTHVTSPPMDFSVGSMPHAPAAYPTHTSATADVLPPVMYDAGEHGHDMRSFSSASSGHSFGSSSPPLLTQPFNPAASSSHGMARHDATMDLHRMEMDSSMLAGMNTYAYPDEPMSADSMRPSTGLGDLSANSSSSLDGALGLSMSQTRRTPPQ